MYIHTCTYPMNLSHKEYRANRWIWEDIRVLGKPVSFSGKYCIIYTYSFLYRCMYTCMHDTIHARMYHTWLGWIFTASKSLGLYWQSVAGENVRFQRVNAGYCHFMVILWCCFFLMEMYYDL